MTNATLLDYPFQSKNYRSITHQKNIKWLPLVVNQLFFIIFSSLLLLPSLAMADVLLPKPAALEPAVKFWTRIYTEFDTNMGLIHDAKNLAIVYQPIEFPKGLSRRQRTKKVKQIKGQIKTALQRLGKGKRNKLSKTERQVLAAWPTGVKNRTLRVAAKSVRFQLGQADKYKAGLIRSGKWRAYIHDIFVKEGLPPELALLPHVESSFNPKAYSKVGAAGLWQFTRDTGRRFMRVDHVVDERMDPFRVTKAAVALLKHNYAVTGTWPLAITSYNHGSAGMRRAAKKIGSTDIAKIIKHYKGRRFGFASRNFYPSFLAAVHVDKNHKKYFGSVRFANQLQPKTIKLSKYVSAKTLSRTLGVDLAVLKKANRALRASVWRGSKYIPKGFDIYVPAASKYKTSQTVLAAIPKQARHAKQKLDVVYVVRRGNTLSQIARRFKTSVRNLMTLNNIRSARRLRVGQRLRLPQAGQRVASVQVAKAKRNSPVQRSAKVDTTPLGATNTKYTVRRGDTLTRIAQRFGIDEQKLIKLNQLRSRHRIYTGQVLSLLKKPVTFRSQTSQLRLAKTNATQSANERKIAESVKTSVATKVAVNRISLTTENTADQPAVENAVEWVKLEQQQNHSADVAEPANADEADAVTPGLPAASIHAQLAADPSNYDVAGNKSIEVQAEETLGHYAEWLGIRASQLRKINKMRFKTPLVVGKRIQLNFSKVLPKEFMLRRIAYHESMQATFFAQYHIAKSNTYSVRRGETLWFLTKNKFKLPLWLLRQYNPDVDFNNLQSKTKITVPVLQENEIEETQISEQAEAA